MADKYLEGKILQVRDNEQRKRLGKEWISINDRMPPEKETVMIIDNSGDISIKSRYENCFCDALGITPIEGNITHWMHLPYAPEGDRK